MAYTLLLKINLFSIINASIVLFHIYVNLVFKENTYLLILNALSKIEVKHKVRKLN